MRQHRGDNPEANREDDTTLDQIIADSKTGGIFKQCRNWSPAIDSFLQNPVMIL